VQLWRNLDEKWEINRPWVGIRRNINVSAPGNLGQYEGKQRESRLYEEYQKHLDQRKQYIFDWLQNPPKSFGAELKNVRRETSIHFRNKKPEYLKEKN